MRISLWGFYQYDPTLFDDVLLPEGLEKDVCIDEIMKRSGDLYTYNQQPDFLKRNITNWFNRNYYQLERMILALTEEYSPIENYDRYEDLKFTPGVKRTETHSGKDTEAHSGTDSESHTGTDGRNIKSYPTATRTTENKVSAFDSSSYSPHDQQTVTGSGYDESQDDFTHGESISTTHGESVDTTHGHKITSEVEGFDQNDNHIHGNIGVTTAMAMINEELNLRRFDIYTDIARRFEKEFLIQIY